MDAPLAANVILARYVKVLAALRRPPTLAFEYSVEQLGLRDMQQVHRVYRNATAERDETLIVDGHPVSAVRIMANRVNRYAIDRVAPLPAAYAFTFRGAVNENNAYGYVFATQARASTSYAVTEIEIDGRTFLPRRVRFKLGGADAHGSGSLTYGRVDRYWLVLAADVSAHLAGGKIAHERIRWSNYHFPTSLPSSTFVLPRPATTASP